MGGCLALLSATAGVGLFQIIHRVETLTQNQIELDRVSGLYILQMRAATHSMEDSLKRVRDYRIAAQVACITVVLCPEALNLLNIGLTSEFVIENGVKAFWTEQQQTWNFGSGERSAYPNFPFPIVQPELGLAGTEAERYLASTPPKFNLRIQRQKLFSTAIAYRDSARDWKVAWTE